MNKALMLVIAIVMTCGMALAAGLGIFSASSSDIVAVQEDTSSDATTSKLVELELEVSDSATQAAQSEAESQESEARQRQRHLELTEDLKLQEVRDTYLAFPAAFDSVIVNYSDEALCEEQNTCAVVESDGEISVDRAWVVDASYQDIEYALARAHAELAIRRSWPSKSAAQIDLEHVISSCEVGQGRSLLNSVAAALGTSPQDRTTSYGAVEAMEDVIVYTMVGAEAPSRIYPSALYTKVQERIAEEIAFGKVPEIVVQVSDANCN